MSRLTVRRLGFALSVVLMGFIAMVALVALPAATALAHPLGNFTINRYARIEVYRDVFRVHYVLDYAEIPAIQLQAEIDRDGDGEMSASELDGYGRVSAPALRQNLSISLNGEPKTLAPGGHVVQAVAGQGGLPVIRAEYVFETAAAGAGDVVVAFSDRNFAERAGWKEIVVRPSKGADVAVEAAYLADRSDALRSYPTETLTSAPDAREVSFGWRAGTGSIAPAVSFAEASERRSGGGLAALLEEDGSVPIIVLSLLVAFVLGAQHAIGPGHGKSMVAAYLVGSRGKPRHAIALGLTVTATHTSTVWLLTLVTLVAAEFIAPDTLFFYLGVSSGALVVVVGAVLLVARTLGIRRRSGPGARHRHGWFGRSHEHSAADPDRRRHDDHSHDHAEGGHHHEAPAAGITWRSLLALGVSGGMLPCPSAIIVMLAAISFGKILFGMALVVAFSLGLAFVLSAIGIALVIGRAASARARTRSLLSHPLVARGVALMPVLSALGVMLAGVYITYEAWSTPL